MREIALWFFRRSLNEEERAERRKWYENPGTTCGEDVIISEPGNNYIIEFILNFKLGNCVTAVSIFFLGKTAGGIILPKQFKDIAEEIYNFELR